MVKLLNVARGRWIPTNLLCEIYEAQKAREDQAEPQSVHHQEAGNRNFQHEVQV